MRDQYPRRTFLKTASAGVVSAVVASSVGESSGVAQASSHTILKKTLKFGMVREEGLSIKEKFQLLKDLGFDGVEMDSPSELDRDEIMRARDEVEFPIPGVIDSVHWRQTLSDPDPSVRAQGVEGLKTAIKDAQAFGASTVLLVPAVVNQEVSYDDAYRRSQEEIRKVLPYAEEHGVKIAIENVWNHFLLSPLEMARYIDEFESPWIGAYFDIGNVVNYGWPEHWIRILGHRILKFDIKEYSREKRDKEGPSAGFRVPLGEGSVDWVEVRRAIREIGYEGWGSAEVRGGDRARLQEISQRMDRILAAS
ncbi:MAG TPA: sugar phosphate isomerase/epimerase family protein [Acidobacteriota bacterium]|nr:sugar phosphate isomerase/epimerase family protein [Acidobacteriota bacterium]